MRFKNVLNRFRRHRSPDRPTPRPKKFTTRLGLEAMEDRLVPSSVTLAAGTLTVLASPNDTIVMREDPGTPGTLDVSAKAGLLGKFPIPSVGKVNITVDGGDVVKVDDSNGFPFAPGTVVSISGTGTNNALDLVGSRALSSNETYAGGAAGSTGSLSAAGVLFTFTNAIGSVTDDLTVNQLVVRAPGQAISLLGPNGLTETLKGLAGPGGGGNNLTFRGKGEVRLELNSANATANLNASKSALLLQNFEVDVFGKNDRVNINTTPSSVTTQVTVAGQFTVVEVVGNLGPVSINGDNTTDVQLGSTSFENNSVTSGIENKVFVEGAETLDLEDGGNVTTQEHMTVTESTISGTGMFGNNAVVVTYEDCTFLDFSTGRLANTYTVTGSHPGAGFVSQIEISNNFSMAALGVQVDVDSGSGLSLGVNTQNPVTGSLVISAPPTAIFSPPTPPNGTEVISFAGGLTSKVFYSGFDNVTLA
jgi:hypothetical protein